MPQVGCKLHSDDAAIISLATDHEIQAEIGKITASGLVSHEIYTMSDDISKLKLDT